MLTIIRFPVGWDGVKFTQPYDQSLHHVELWHNPQFKDFMGISFNWNVKYEELPTDAKHSYVNKHIYHKLTLAEAVSMRDALTEIIENMGESNDSKNAA
jgi:hypothetical protein